MDYKADIGFINSHAKSIGRHNDRRPVVDKILLILLTLRIA